MPESLIYTSAPELPLEVKPGLWWLGGCSDVGTWQQWNAAGPINRHEHINAFLVTSGERTFMVETGHVAHWPAVRRQLEIALDGRDLDYVFPTHSELPHAGNLARLFALYPTARAVGYTDDFRLLFPDIDPSRLTPTGIGDQLDLGGVKISFHDALWKDLPASLWALDHTHNALFSADSFLYGHRAGDCAKTSEQLTGLPANDLTHTPVAQIWSWAKYHRMGPKIEKLRSFLADHNVEMICPSHGGPILGTSSDLIDRLLAAIAAVGVDHETLAEAFPELPELSGRAEAPSMLAR